MPEQMIQVPENRVAQLDRHRLHKPHSTPPMQHRASGYTESVDMVSAFLLHRGGNPWLLRRKLMEACYTLVLAACMIALMVQIPSV